MEMPMDAELAELIHVQHRTTTEDLRYWLALAARLPAPALELGCGSGRVLLALEAAGFPVWGIDHDPHALAILRREAGENDLRLIEGDFTSLKLTQRFGLLYMPCNTYSTLDDGARARLLAAAMAHLTPGGVFAASLPNPALLAGLEDGEPDLEETIRHPRTGDPVQVLSEWKRAADRLTVHWHYDHLQPDGRVTRRTAAVIHHLTPVEDLLGELARAGFTVQVWGDFERRPFSPDSATLVFEAVARG